jgi:hypothetical protein
MTRVRFIACLVAFSALTFAAHAQQLPPNPYAAACGATEANFTVKHAPSPNDPLQPPAGKALVYIINSMHNYPLISKKVNIGLDGAWIGAADGLNHFGFPVDPGPHHLCAVYQGHAANMDEEGQIMLLHLDAKPGHIYYIRYSVFLTEGGSIAAFEPVDEDEGLFLVQRTEAATSSLKK